jgi:hypothetical protein
MNISNNIIVGAIKTIDDITNELAFINIWFPRATTSELKLFILAKYLAMVREFFLVLLRAPWR